MRTDPRRQGRGAKKLCSEHQKQRTRGESSILTALKSGKFSHHHIQTSRVVFIVHCCLGGSLGEEGLKVQRGSSKDANNGTLSIHPPFSLFLHNYRAESALLLEVLKEGAFGYG